MKWLSFSSKPCQIGVGPCSSLGGTGRAYFQTFPNMFFDQEEKEAILCRGRGYDSALLPGYEHIRLQGPYQAELHATEFPDEIAPMTWFCR